GFHRVARAGVPAEPRNGSPGLRTGTGPELSSGRRRVSEPRHLHDRNGQLRPGEHRLRQRGRGRDVHRRRDVLAARRDPERGRLAQSAGYPGLPVRPEQHEQVRDSRTVAQVTERHRLLLGLRARSMSRGCAVKRSAREVAAAAVSLALLGFHSEARAHGCSSASAWEGISSNILELSCFTGCHGGSGNGGMPVSINTDDGWYAALVNRDRKSVV